MATSIAQCAGREWSEGKKFMNDITAQKWINEIIRLKRRIKTLEDVNFKRGRWIEDGHYERCSECGEPTNEYHNYCPNCGAKMEGDI